jgi:L-threonylcarbamoyladenylate synthase
VNPAALAEAARVIGAGGVVAYPTESCYGLGCDPRRHAAVARILRLKRRTWQQGLILIADHPDRLRPWLAPVPVAVWDKVTAVWPGPVSWLLPARAGVSPWLRGVHDTLAVRVTAHAGAAALARHAARAIVSTSANRHGQRPARSAQEVRRVFGAAVDYVLEGPLGAAERPSEIRDARTDAVIRAA